MERAGRFVDILTHFVYRYTLQIIVVVLGVALALYAFLHFGVSAAMMESLEESTHERLISDIEFETLLLGHELKDIEKDTSLLNLEYSDFFQRIDTYETTDASFAVHNNGSYYKTRDNGGGSLYYSMITPLTDYAKNKASKSEALDSIMKYLVDDSELIVQSFFNTFDHMTRIYPYREDISLLFGPDMEVDKYNFYYLADELHNPERDVVWTPPYYDPAGQGWIVSCVSPVYNGNFLEGVVGVDVTIDALVEHTLDMNESETIATLILDNTGLIIASNQVADHLIGIERLNTVIAGRVTTEILKPDSYNVYKLENSDIGEAFVSIFESDIHDVTIKDQSYYVNKQTLDITAWTIVTLTPSEYIHLDVEDFNKKIYFNVIVIILVLLLLVFFMVMFYRSKIKHMAMRVSKPLDEMVSSAKTFGLDGKHFARANSSGILEIDLLNRELFMMSKAIQERNHKIIEVQLENQEAEKAIEVYHKESITDTLTQVYNRRKIDEVIDAEVKRSRRYKKPFSIILMDVDRFKEINDMHGHQLGDEVLKHFAQVISVSVRESDVVSRWGGDEFLIVVFESDHAAAYHIAEKIRMNVASNAFKHDVRLTTSIGVATFDFVKDNAREIVRKADLALYEAKNSGRNTVISYMSIGEKDE